jgi:hypothetical protein
MMIYKRYVDKKLLSLRLSFFILVPTCFLAFKYLYNNLGYFIAVTLITISIIVVKEFIVFSDSFQISKYYFFGLIKRNWQFNKAENIRISSFGSDFGEDGDIPDNDPTASGIGCLFSIFSVFMPPKIVKKEFKIEALNKSNNLIKRTNIFLDKCEFNYLLTFIR